MIELNLIEAASRPVSVSVAPRITVPKHSESKEKKRAGLLAVAAVLALLIVGVVVLKLAGVPKALEGVLPAPVLSVLGIEDPSRSGPELGVRISGQTTTAGGNIASRRAEEEAAAVRKAQVSSPERVVQDIRPEIFQKEKRSAYADLLPMEKVVFQKSMAAQILAFINAVTPDGVSFADIVFEAPNFYSIRGVAESPVIQKNYLERLKMGSSEFKTPQLPENAPATSITAYGVLSAKAEATPAAGIISFVKESELAKETEALRALDAGGKMRLSGFKKPKVEDFGVYKSTTYHLTTSADFQTVLRFVDALSKSPVRVGVEKLRMSAAGKNGVSTSMTLVVYTQD